MLDMTECIDWNLMDWHREKRHEYNKEDKE
jgi:hypothetical protein